MADLLKKSFRIISLFGTPFFYVPATAYLFTLTPKLAINLVFVLVSTEFLCGAVKFIYPKERPVPMPRNTIFQKYLAGSFPSVHTARITAFSAAIAAFYTNTAFILVASLAVICVGYSRIYLKKHYPIDVLAGFAVGLIIGAFGLIM